MITRSGCSSAICAVKVSSRHLSKYSAARPPDPERCKRLPVQTSPPDSENSHEAGIERPNLQPMGRIGARSMKARHLQLRRVGGHPSPPSDAPSSRNSASPPRLRQVMTRNSLPTAQSMHFGWEIWLQCNSMPGRYLQSAVVGRMSALPAVSVPISVVDRVKAGTSPRKHQPGPHRRNGFAGKIAPRSFHCRKRCANRQNAGRGLCRRARFPESATKE